MRRRVVVAHLLLVAAVLVLLEVPLAVTFARREREALADDVARDAASLEALTEEVLEDPAEHDLSALGRFGGDEEGSAAVVVDADGRSIDPSVTPAASLSGSLRDALDGARAGVPSSGRVGHRAYAAEPVGSAGEIHGAVLVVHAGTATERRIRQLWLALGGIAVAALGVAAVLGDRLARWATGPLRDLDDRAAALGRGDLGARADESGGPPEVVELARTFNAMAARLEELVGAQRRFIADASHQLRSPLAALRLRLDALDPGDPETAQADIDAAVAETLRLSRVIDGLLALAQAEGSRPGRTRADVVELVAGRRAAWSAYAEEHGVDLRADLPEHPVPASLVDGHLEQILDNLIDNAIEATPAGRAVTVVVRAGSPAVEIHVVDEGQGMSPDQLAQAFDRFWQGGHGERTGTGLGLPIAAQLARAGGGALRLQPAAGGGVDALITLASD